MESSPIGTLQAEQQQQPPVQPGPNLEQILSLCMYMPIEELIEDYPYAVTCVDRWFDDIFVVQNCLIDEFNRLRLPQTDHESFTRFLEVLRSRNVQDLFIEHLGSAEKGQPLLRADGGGFSTYLW